jgi:hypothetical protein
VTAPGTTPAPEGATTKTAAEQAAAEEAAAEEAAAEQTILAIQAAAAAAGYAAEAAQAAAEAAAAAAQAAGTAPAGHVGQAGGTWGPPTPIGHHVALQSVGGIAAPLLAGFSFTMTSVLLTASDHPCRWLNVALALFVLAGLVLIFAVQSAVWLQSYAAKPSDYLDWFPQDAFGNSPTSTLVTRQIKDSGKAGTWAKATRRLYNLGILLLLAGVATAVVPPGHIPRERWVVIGVGAVGFIVELVWVAWSRKPKEKA